MSNIKLSLIIPTRNRSEYLAAGVEFFLKSTRDNIELIVCDASDSHQDCSSVLKPWIHDSRLHIIDNSLGTTKKLSSMAENWSRALDHAQGEWICIIGDDDICDPVLVDFIEKFENAAPNIHAITWHHGHFDINIELPRECKIPMGSKIMVASGKDSLLKQTSWPDAKKPPTSLCSTYHGATRRKLLEHLKLGRDGWFIFRTPDYDLGWSIANMVESFAICERPFTIAGVSPKSNSYSVRNEDARIENLKNWIHESANLDGWGVTNDPFLFSLPMTILGFRNAFCTRNGISSRMHFENFMGCLKNSVAHQEDESSFINHHAAMIKYLKINFGLDSDHEDLKRIIRNSEPFAGLVGDKLLSPNTIFDGDINKFAKFAFGIVRPVKYLF
jgi:glycosyltransferase involved in cell wall biosynthesis